MQLHALYLVLPLAILLGLALGRWRRPRPTVITQKEADEQIAASRSPTWREPKHSARPWYYSRPETPEQKRDRLLEWFDLTEASEDPQRRAALVEACKRIERELDSTR